MITRLVRRALMFVGALTILTLFLTAGIAYFTGRVGRGVPARVLLEVDIERGLSERAPDDPTSALVRPRSPVMHDAVDALERAAADDRVVGLIARVGNASIGLGQIQEVRDAVALFRRSRKPAVAYAETLGEGPGTGAYYLATAFEEIWLQPSGDVGLTGLLVEMPFFRGTLDKVGVVPRLDHRKEYKSAMNQFTERRFTEPQAEATGVLMRSQFGQIVRGIAEARGLDDAAVRAAADGGPLDATEALAAKLIDGIAYRDEVVARLKERTATTERLTLIEYLARAGRPNTSGDTIALIYGVGEVRRGRSEFNPLSGDATLGADTVVSAFRDAVKDETVKAIVFRIDSPGGSYVASDTMRRAIVRAREKGKPVIATMGNVAASGGYFIAMPCDKIVAQPGTVTGSIGVLSGKMLTAGLWEKLGVSWDGLQTGPNAGIWSGLHDYTPGEWRQLQDSLDRIYADFTDKVAADRKLPKDKVLAAAKGRIWSGEDARALGLVDALGGYEVALRLAREAAGLAADAPIRVQVFPPEKTVIEVLVARALGRDEDEGGEAGSKPAPLEAALATLRPLVQLARELTVRGDDVLRMPPLVPPR